MMENAINVYEENGKTLLNRIQCMNAIILFTFLILWLNE